MLTTIFQGNQLYRRWLKTETCDRFWRLDYRSWDHRNFTMTIPYIFDWFSWLFPAFKESSEWCAGPEEPIRAFFTNRKADGKMSPWILDHDYLTNAIDTPHTKIFGQFWAHFNARNQTNVCKAPKYQPQPPEFQFLEPRRNEKLS